MLAAGNPRMEIFPIREASIHVPSTPEASANADSVAGQTLDVSLPREVMCYHGKTFSHGLPELSAVLRAHMSKWHHPPVEGWDLMVTSGTTDGINKLVLLLTEPGDAILASEYCYSGFLAGPVVQGRDVVGVAMDEGGILPTALDAKCSELGAVGRPPRLLYLTPTGQNPTGCTLSVERRRLIYSVCRKHDLIILEDDPYYFLQMPEYDATASESVPEGSSGLCITVPSFLSMDTDRRVIRLDSFSKLIAPGLRLGWMTGPREIMERVGLFTQITSWSLSGLPQSALLALLNHWGESGFERHIAYLQRFYTRRRNALLAALDKHLCNNAHHSGSSVGREDDDRPVASWQHPRAGMFVWITIPGVQDTDGLVDMLMEEKVVMMPGSGFRTSSGCLSNCFRATFASVDLNIFDEAIARFARVVRRSAPLATARKEVAAQATTRRKTGYFGRLAMTVLSVIGFCLLRRNRESKE